jgi:hypothetical protein
MQKRKLTALCSLIIMLAIAVPLVCTPIACAAETINFYLPSNSPNWQNVVYGNDNVGVIHIDINTTSSGTPDTWAEAYCISHNQNIYVGNTYTATLNPATETPVSKSIGYIMAWYHSQGTYSPTDSTHPGYSNAEMTQNQAASIQNAIWYFTDGFAPSGDAASIVVDASGKDVIRATDHLAINKISSTPTQVTVEATVTQADGTTPRSNVLVVFKTAGVTAVSGLSSAIAQWNTPTGYSYEGITNANGKIVFTISPDKTASVVQVDACSRGVWPQVLDSRNGIQVLQVLTPASITSNLVVKTAFFVLPEYPLGALLALASFAAAFVVFQKRKPA